MAGGGIWKTQNKVRPGAYINFKSKPKPLGTLGDRGVMTCALPLTWGPQSKLIPLYASDLLDGKSLSKVGVTALDGDESLPFRLALSGCKKALIFRSDSGGEKATGTAGDTIEVDAKYNGTTGNLISVKIENDKPVAGTSKVSILFKSKVQEEFEVLTADASVLEEIESEWVDFTVTGSIAAPETANLVLSGGANGTVEEANFTDYFNLLPSEQWQCMAVDSTVEAVNTAVANNIKHLRENAGKKVQGVIYNDVTHDFEGVISTKQGFKTETEVIPTNLFPIWVASHTAGAYINESLTSFVVPGAVEIVNPIGENDIADELQKGWFLLSYRQDGKVIVEQDINTLVTLTPDKGYEYTKNRVIRCADEIGNQVKLIFTRSYSGKVDNDSTGRKVYKSELINMLENLQGINAVTNVDGPGDITVLPGEAIDAVVAELAVQFVDSMEKLYMVVESE